MTPVGEAHLHLKLGTQAWSYPFIISELGSTNAITGNDFIYGLFMGTSLVDTTKTLVPVTLLNLGEETKHLPRGLEVGVVEEVESGVIEENKSNPIVQLPGNKVKHLAELLNRMGSNLSTEQAEQVKDVIMEYSDVFTAPDGELGHTTLVQHEIDTGNHHP